MFLAAGVSFAPKYIMLMTWSLSNFQQKSILYSNKEVLYILWNAQYITLGLLHFR